MKKFISLILICALSLGMTACGGDGKIELNIIAAQYGQNTAEWWAGLERDFEAAHENVDLVVDVVSWNDIYTVVNTRISGNKAPDILNIDVFADYQADGLLLPAQDYVSPETYAKMYPIFLEQSEVDGTVWAVPDLASVRALYYNVDLLNEADVEVPTTWAELRAACEKLSAFYGDKVYPWGVDMTTDEGQACFAYYAWNNGGDFVDADGNWTLNSPENVEALEYVLGLYNDGLTNTAPATENRYDLQDMFGGGRIAMMIAPNSLPTYCAANGLTVNYGVAPIPTNEGKAEVCPGVMDRFMCFDNGYSDDEMAAITAFFDFFYEDQRYAEWVQMEDFLPATTTAGEIVSAANEKMGELIDMYGICKFYPTAKAEWADVKQGVINAEQQALLGGDARQLLDALQAQIAG